MTSLLEVLRSTGFKRRALVSWLNGCVITCERRGAANQYREVYEFLCRCLAALDEVPDASKRNLDVMGRARAASMLMNRCMMTSRGASDGLAPSERDAILLGTLREDVEVLPATNFVYEHPSLDHAYRVSETAGFVRFLSVGAVKRCRRLYDRATVAHRREGGLTAYMWLGRVLHIVGDLMVPVHAYATAHASDPFEWMIEARYRALLELPRPEADFVDVENTIRTIAMHTRRTSPDQEVPIATLWAQAQDLVPHGLAHAAALVRGFQRQVAASEVSLPQQETS